MHDDIRRHWEARTTEEVLGNNLIHGVGAGVDAASYVWQAQNFEESLKRPIFTGMAVEYREHHGHAGVSQRFPDGRIKLQENHI